ITKKNIICYAVFSFAVSVRRWNYNDREQDIPGGSLCGRRLSELKNKELKFWLKCRGDPGKGLKTKAELVKRVEEYIKIGKDKNIVDPEPTGLYTKKTPAAVLKSGFIVSEAFPILGASLDVKVIDFGSSICFGLAEVKCPHTKFHVEACSDPNFFMEKISDTQCRLKRDHVYYGQVRGQMGGTGAKWERDLY
ncbi:unnamed protein product, partial [Porites evermanni]